MGIAGLPHAFTRDNAPRQGGKPGRVRKYNLERAVNARLDRLFQMAHENVEDALERGDTEVSTWYLAWYEKRRGTVLKKGLLAPLLSAINTFDDVPQVSRQALLLAIDGDMSFEQLKAVQEAIARHSVLSGMVELRHLREEVDLLMHGKPGEGHFGKEHMPIWGRLAKDVEDAEEVPAKASGGNGKAA